MILPDANLLLYAYHPASPEHARSKEWLEKILSDARPVRFAWQTLWAFLRISTNRNVFEHPLTMSEAVMVVSSWLQRPNAGIVEPEDRHWDILQQLLAEGQCIGPLVTDAALAAIATEHAATVHTTDRDFSRFGSLDWIDPIREA
jgi:toxin-antitoxin system PIN domain toxin